MTETIVSESSSKLASAKTTSGNSILLSEIDDLKIQTFNSFAPLQAYVEQWNELSGQVADANAFYESFFLLAANSPSLAHTLTKENDWRLTVVTDSKTESLIGFFPFVQSRGFAGLRQWSLWKSDFSFLSTPLIQAGSERIVLAAVLEHVQKSRPHIDLIEFPMSLASGRIHQEWHGIIRDHLLTAFQYDHYCRAELRSQTDFDSYLNNSVGRHHFREYRRQRRRLESLGQLEYRSNRDPRHADAWANWFLELEAKGWKGEEKTAMLQHPEQANFFRELVQRGMKLGRVEMKGLFIDGEPIALACSLTNATGSFAFKIAFDENYRKYSPGIQLQLCITQDCHESEDQQWIDSCAIPNHPMINRLWSERRSIEHIIVSTGRNRAKLLVSAMPFLRTVKRMLKKPQKTKQ